MKNKFMRIAAVTLMLCLVTTCAISGTFAKYTTENTAKDTARVAKWGVTVTAPADATNTTFTANYESDDLNYTADTVIGAADVVAPGTDGTLATPTISGTPEVAVRVTLEATLKLENWTAGSEEYCPIVFTVDGVTYGTEDTDATNKSGSVAALITAVETAIENYSKDYAANTNLNTTSTTDIPDVSWAWAIDVDDAKDTALGDAAATGTAASIEFSLKVIVTQID